MRRLEVVAREAQRLALAEGPLDYLLVRRRGRRGVGLKVDETGLTVSAPATMPLARVEALVREHERWIVRQVAAWSGRRVPVISWLDGAGLPYLGGRIHLRLVEGGRLGAGLDDGELRVSAPDGTPGSVRRAVTSWYRREARAYLAPRLEARACAAGLAPPRFVLSPAMARWGSCNSMGEVRLAWRLIKAPPPLIDYVICHELAHLRHMDHSAAFWAEVERQCPGHRELRRQLFATDHLYRSF